MRCYKTLSRLLYNRCSKSYVVVIAIALKISQNVENTEKNFFLTIYIEKDIQMSSVYFWKIECYHKLNIVAGTRESVVHKAEILLSWCLREDKHINYNYQNGW